MNPRAALRPSLPVNRWLAPYRWYRRWVGGHWEQWCFAVGSGYPCLWLRLDACTRGTGWRPVPCALGLPFCEDW